MSANNDNTNKKIPIKDIPSSFTLDAGTMMADQFDKERIVISKVEIRVTNKLIAGGGLFNSVKAFGSRLSKGDSSANSKVTTSASQISDQLIMVITDKDGYQHRVIYNITKPSNVDNNVRSFDQWGKLSNAKLTNGLNTPTGNANDKLAQLKANSMNRDLVAAKAEYNAATNAANKQKYSLAAANAAKMGANSTAVNEYRVLKAQNNASKLALNAKNRAINNSTERNKQDQILENKGVNAFKYDNKAVFNAINSASSTTQNQNAAPFAGGKKAKKKKTVKK